MAILTMMGRKSYLKNRINELEYKLTQAQQRRNDLSTYAASVGDGSISYEDLTSCPSNLFGRMTQYMMTSHNAAMMGAQQNMALLQGSGQLGQVQGTDQAAIQQQNAYQNLVFQQLYKQQRDQFAQYESKRLNAEEKQLDQECIKIENELTLVQNEYASLNKVMDSAAQNDTARYIA